MRRAERAGENCSAGKSVAGLSVVGPNVDAARACYQQNDLSVAPIGAKAGLIGSSVQYNENFLKFTLSRFVVFSGTSHMDYISAHSKLQHSSEIKVVRKSWRGIPGVFGIASGCSSASLGLAFKKIREHQQIQAWNLENHEHRKTRST